MEIEDVESRMAYLLDEFERAHDRMGRPWGDYSTRLREESQEDVEDCLFQLEDREQVRDTEMVESQDYDVDEERRIAAFFKERGFPMKLRGEVSTFNGPDEWENEEHSETEPWGDATLGSECDSSFRGLSEDDDDISIGDQLSEVPLEWDDPYVVDTEAEGESCNCQSRVCCLEGVKDEEIDGDISIRREDLTMVNPCFRSPTEAESLSEKAELAGESCVTCSENLPCEEGPGEGMEGEALGVGDDELEVQLAGSISKLIESRSGSQSPIDSVVEGNFSLEACESRSESDVSEERLGRPSMSGRPELLRLLSNPDELGFSVGVSVFMSLWSPVLKFIWNVSTDVLRGMVKRRSFNVLSFFRRMI